jgi:hypothetical protein
MLPGSTHIITPKQFVHDVCRLREGPPKELPPPPPPQPMQPSSPGGVEQVSAQMDHLQMGDGGHNQAAHGKSKSGHLPGKAVFSLFGKKK